MKHWKKPAALLLAAAMLAAGAGCDLVKVDEKEDKKQVVATVNGEEILKERYQASYDNYALQAQMYGQSIEGQEESILDGLIEYEVLKQQAEKGGYYDLTPEREEEFNKTYDEEIKSIRDSYFRPTAESELGEGATEEEIEAKVDELFAADIEAQGFTMDELRQDYLDNAAINWMYTDIADKIELTDADVQTWYDEELAAQETAITQDPTMYDQYATYNPPVLYVPAGFKDVKHILIAFSEEASASLSSLKTEQDNLVTQMAELMRDEKTNATKIDELRKENDALVVKLDELKADAKAKAEEVLQKVQAGGDFDALMEEYSDDTGSMANEEYLKNGMRVGPDNTLYVPEFTAGAMELGVNEVSGLVETDYGYHIIKNIKDVPEGAVPLADVKEAAEEKALQKLQSEAWTKQLEEWKTDANIEKFLDVLTDNTDNYAEEEAAS